jgi:hypothetical protein
MTQWPRLLHLNAHQMPIPCPALAITEPAQKFDPATSTKFLAKNIGTLGGLGDDYAHHRRTTSSSAATTTTATINRYRRTSCVVPSIVVIAKSF